MTGPSTLRSQNRSTILQLLLEYGPLPKAILSQRSGLSTVTVNAITNELLEDRLLVEVGKTGGSAGRPGAIFDFDSRVGTLAGIDVQPHLLTILTADIRGGRQECEAVEIAGPVTPALIRTIERLDVEERHGPLRQVTLAVPAPVGSGWQLLEPNSLPELSLTAVAEAVAARGIRLHADNDANLAAVAEQISGAGQGHSSFALLVTRDTGVGLGLILGGQLYQGHDGQAGELALAHWPLEGRSVPIEQLPSREQEAAIAYLVSGAAVTLNLSRLVVFQAHPDPHSQLLPLLRELLASHIPVLESRVGELGPALGALTVATTHYARHLCSAASLPRPLSPASGG